VATLTITQQIELLDQLKHEFDPRAAARIVRLLGQLSVRRFSDANDLAKYHETALFIRAYPANSEVMKAADHTLAAIPAQLKRMREAEIDLSPLAEVDLSGIFTTSVSGVFSFPVASWLAHEHANEITINWNGYEDEARLGETLPRFMPLLADETLVEAHFPYLEWLRSAAGPPEKAAPWLIGRIEELNMTAAERSELYDALQLYLTWTPKRYSITRTGMRLSHGKIFFHEGPMLARRDVSIAKELNGPRLPRARLSRRDAAKLLESIRQTSALRYRELHGFSYGDTATFLRFDAGRGIDIYVNEPTPDHRLPLRAYHSAFMVKNGVPVGYVEGLSLFDRMEIGFNIYYTFRDGESAYLYAKVMKIFHQLLGINCFSVDPYQIGHENEEGLDSGAFWFYRKLGFQPARADLLALVHREEEQIAAKPGYRTSRATLKKIAVGHVFYDQAAGSARNWCRFQVHNLGLAAQRRMKRDFAGRAELFRAAAEAKVAKSLSINPRRWSALDQSAFSNWAAVLFLIEDLAEWTNAEKKLAVHMIKAKGSSSEVEYLRLMQQHERLRDAMIRLGRS
jgi:hypothetical protein